MTALCKAPVLYTATTQLAHPSLSSHLISFVDTVSLSSHMHCKINISSRPPAALELNGHAAAEKYNLAIANLSTAAAEKQHTMN